MSAPLHELIRASAGTGKTFQLTNRYLALMFRGAAPERIVALTFTRKAAGEFFTKIFQRLAGGAESAAGAAALSAQVGIHLTQADCLRHMRTLLQNLHRLELSTYDSFFTRIVQAFPFELGLAAAPTLLGNDETDVQVRRAQQALSRRTATDAEFLAEFWQACKRATMGVDAKSVTEQVIDFIRANHSLFFESAELARWGDAGTIWQGACPWTGPDLDLAAEAEALRDALPWGALKARQKQFWEEYVTEIAAWQPPAAMPARVDYMTKKLAAVFDSLESGACQVTIQSKQSIGQPEGEILKRLTRFAFMQELGPRLEATQGIHGIVRLFEEVYAAEVRRAGKITLQDATLLLAGSDVHGNGLADPELRERIGYRLDGNFDHWLLDEFQDTSRAQWRTMAELVDEALQDTEGKRTFFAVGDTKQSIYGWRGSDDRLFDRVQRRYQSVLSIRSLSESHRSAAPVLAMVNEVFGNEADIAELTSPAVGKRWAGMWETHTSHESRSELSGHSALIHAPESDKVCFGTVLRILQAIRPLDRGLSAAVLVRENGTADSLVEYLRGNGGPACSLAANVRPGSDNVVAAGLRSLLTLAAHPSDTLAWCHLRMTPMGKGLEEKFVTPAALSKHVLGLWSAAGISGIVDYWAAICRPHLDAADGFNLGRLETCRNAAAAADALGAEDLDAFVRGMDGMELREHDVPGQVAVMTVHKAKGLDWDVVILTDLDGNKLSERRRGGLSVQRDAAGGVEWILDMPTSELAGCDPVLAARIAEAADDAAFERLCALYVGLTRAKRGLYVVTQAATGTSANYRRLLDTTLAASPAELKLGDETFTGAWQNGDRDWFLSCAQKAAGKAADDSIQALAEPLRRSDRRPVGTLPSGADNGDWRLAFSGRGESLDFGSAVHAALAKVEWLRDSRDVEQAVAGLDPEAEECVLAALTDSTARTLFEPGDGTLEAWREMPFEWVNGDEWVTGRFDRVIVRRSDQGRIVSATLIDFKTAAKSRVVAADAFDEQLSKYRAALAALCAIPLDAIQTKVLLLQPGNIEVRDVALPSE